MSVAVRSSGAGPRNCSPAGSIQSREKLALPRRHVTKMEREVGSVGECWSGNTFTSMGSWIMRQTGGGGDGFDDKYVRLCVAGVR